MSSSSADTSLFGWDLTFNSVKQDIKTKEDVLAVIIHWCLVKAGFRCVGVGESMEECESDSPSELLPEGWNCTDNYALRYTYKGNLYNLAINKSGTDVVFVNIIHKGQNYGLDVKLNDVIKEINGPMGQIVPSYKDFIKRVQTNLIDNLTELKQTDSETQTSDSKREKRSLRVDPSDYHVPSNPRIPPDNPYLQQDWIDPLSDPRQVGVADLNPFGRGGGMLFAPPPNRPGVARGSVPPGARFDPFRPDVHPEFPPRRPPGTDHLPPPGYDDMFM